MGRSWPNPRESASEMILGYLALREYICVYLFLREMQFDIREQVLGLSIGMWSGIWNEAG